MLPGARRRSGGFLGAAYGARSVEEFPPKGGNGVERNGSERSEVASVCYEEAAREPLAPGGETPQGIAPIRNRPIPRKQFSGA